MNAREATAADVPALHLIEQRSMGVDAWTLTQLAEELTRPGAIFLVSDGPKPVGLAIGFVVFDELQVMQIAVDPDARRQGHARILLAALEAAARAADVSYLEVRVDNDPAIQLYVSAGYRIVGRRPRYYADGVDALLMRKGLRPESQLAEN